MEGRFVVVNVSRSSYGDDMTTDRNLTDKDVEAIADAIAAAIERELRPLITEMQESRHIINDRLGRMNEEIENFRHKVTGGY